MVIRQPLSSISASDNKKSRLDVALTSYPIK